MNILYLYLMPTLAGDKDTVCSSAVCVLDDSKTILDDSIDCDLKKYITNKLEVVI